METNLPENEEKILKFWKKHKIFEKSIKQRKNCPVFSFYDGPPFATGLPHYGHILATTIKDAVLRYWTMQGYQVPRRVGWDCHGLPVENLIEKELELKTKKDIEKLGIEKFNNSCENSVFRCVKDFQKTLERVGRWADYSNAYATMDNNYIESVWWVMAQLYKQKLIYKDFRVTPYCPRCGTALSNFELNQPGAYQDIEEESIYIKFSLKKQKDTYLLVWTTTPWTLPANTAVAVNSKFDYVKVKIGKEHFILAKERLSALDSDYEIIEEFKGKKLIGLEYKTLFKTEKIKDKIQNKNIHKVVDADFVSLEDGTGMVHIAPAFGVDDMELGKKENLPVLITVDLEGKIIKGQKLPGEGKFVKTADKEIKEDLEKRKILFKKENIIHSYPFCWRCDTPLLYYPIDSWYVAVTKFKKQLVENNKKINWVPSHLKDGRFGKWLEDARDWSFSRNRYWGAPIPIWECEKCDNIQVVESIESIRKELNGVNKIFLLRHGEAENNIKNILSCFPEKKQYNLTIKGKKQIETLAKELKNQKIDIIFSSPILRTKETAEILSKKLGVEIIFDKRLIELNLGQFNGGSYDKFIKIFAPEKLKEGSVELGVESGEQMEKRLKNFLKDLNKKYNNKNIIIISHGNPLQVLYGIINGIDVLESYVRWNPSNGTPKVIFSKKINLHRPYIDNVILKCDKCGKKMKRVDEVFDCWFESGSMPFAQWHYPFENKEFVEKTFPADFIAEGMDQTRGWFYTLNVLSTALFNQPAFKNVIVNGLVLGEDGKKLSKRLKNYTAPEIIFNKQGADALRYFLLSSSQIGENYIVSEKRIAEVLRRTILTFWNSCVFYDMYADKRTINPSQPKPTDLLDKWIISRLNSSNQEIDKYMKKYELTKATRIFDSLIDDLSNWYIRRSRKRLQRPDTEAEKKQTSEILHYILLDIAKLFAPFIPFLSENIYQKLAGKKESIHLEDYPKSNKKLIDKDLEEKMKITREITTLALAERAEIGIKVRQPLASLKIQNSCLAGRQAKSKIQNNKELLDLIKEEINVKEIIFDKKIKKEIELDTILTSELKEEGTVREIIRQIQAMRKKAGYKPRHRVLVRYSGSSYLNKILEKNKNFILKDIAAENFQIGDRPKMVFDIEREIEINQEKLWLGIKKI